jgi:tRNA 2-thiouridine synthesizing protein A
MSDQPTCLDLRGLKCPLPALARSHPGTIVEVIADDPLAPVDLPHMCAQEGFEVVDSAREGNCLRILLRRP